MTSIAGSAAQAAPAVPRPAPVLPRPSDARTRRWRLMLPLMVVIALGMLLTNLFVGLGNMLTPVDVWRAYFDRENAERLHVIAVDSRLPRAVLGMLVGAGLAAAGGLMQALTRNPLASSDLLGVSQGAVMAAVVWIVFGPVTALASFWAMPALATFGGFVSAMITYTLSRRSSGGSAAQFLLIGILVGGVLSSVTSVTLIFAGDSSIIIIEWLTGSLSLKRWDHVQLSALYLLPGFLMVLIAIPRANALQLGDGTATSLGQKHHTDRLIVLFGSVLLTAGAVAVVGGVGFVGLMGPHIMRRWVGNDQRRLIPAAALCGASMVLIADLMARMLVPGRVIAELLPGAQGGALPVGVYLTLFGIPFLITLLRKRV